MKLKYRIARGIRNILKVWCYLFGHKNKVVTKIPTEPIQTMGGRSYIYQAKVISVRCRVCRKPLIREWFEETIKVVSKLKQVEEWVKNQE